MLSTKCTLFWHLICLYHNTFQKSHFIKTYSAPKITHQHSLWIIGIFSKRTYQVDADIEPIEMSEVDKEVTVVRVRGKLSLTCSQNETELGNVFKYLLEKVSCVVSYVFLWLKLHTLHRYVLVAAYFLNGPFPHSFIHWNKKNLQQINVKNYPSSIKCWESN